MDGTAEKRWRRMQYEQSEEKLTATKVLLEIATAAGLVSLAVIELQEAQLSHLNDMYEAEVKRRMAAERRYDTLIQHGLDVDALNGYKRSRPWGFDDIP